MSQIKELLVEELQDLLHAETQLTERFAEDGGGCPSSEAEGSI